MKKILKMLSLLSVFMLCSITCNAMVFSPMEKLGRIGCDQKSGGIMVYNANTNSGSYFTKYNKHNTLSYHDGTAVFGSGSSALYFYYNSDTRPMIYVGNKQKDTIYPISDLGNEVYRIKSDTDITLYPILFWYGPERFYDIYGIRADGKCVSYINTCKLIEQYFGKQGALPIICGDPIVYDDTIVIPLKNYMLKEKKIGKLIFRWDNKAQWFSVNLSKY